MTSPTPSPRPGAPRPGPTPAAFGALPGSYAWATPSAAKGGGSRSREDAGPVGEVTTGDEEIDAALRELAGLAERPLREHITAGEHVHALLQSRLGDLGGS